MSVYKIFGFTHSAIYLAIGIACLVISLRNTVDCGEPGFPPLRNWLFGTGIGYTVIGGSMGLGGLILALTVIGIIPLIIILILSGPFTFAWMIVGAVSLWRDGANCAAQNFEIWQMGMAAVICSIVLVVSNIVSYRFVVQEQQ